MRISEEIEIKAPASAVWHLLTDFNGYPAWNPFIRQARGTLAVGSRLQLSVSIPDGRSMKLRPTVIGLIPGQELRWVGGLWVAGLFEGDHRFSIQPLGPATVRFIQTEVFKGILAPFLGGWVARGARKGFRAMNGAMKKTLERKTP